MAQSKGDRETPDVLTLDEVTPEKGNVDFQDQIGVISGNVHRGGVIRGGKDLTIEGEVLGVAESRCSIEVGGDVEIEQSVTCARITARSITIEGDVEACNLQVDNSVEIHGNLSETEISIGSRSADIRRMNRMFSDQRTEVQKVSALQVQISSMARRFIRDYPEVNLKMGNILVPGSRELRVNLEQFYSAIDTDDEEKAKRALEEFYLRVVVGMLTRSNKDYISRNPSRHKVFLRLVEDLRTHMFRVREFDSLKDRIQNIKSEARTLLNALKEPEAPVRLRVGGSVSNGVSIHIAQLGGFTETPAGTIDIQRTLFDVRVVSPEDSDGLALEIRDPSGDSSVVEPDGGVFENGSFLVEYNTVIWQTGE